MNVLDKLINRIKTGNVSATTYPYPNQGVGHIELGDGFYLTGRSSYTLLKDGNKLAYFDQEESSKIADAIRQRRGEIKSSALSQL